MEGLLFLGFFAVYFLCSFLVIKATVSWAKKRGRSAWRWGLLATFLMYNLMFWDWIPSVVLQSYYCKTEAGFWVYKSPEQWAAENPEAIKTLTYKRVNDMTVIEHGYTDHLNQRIDLTYKKTHLWPNISRYEDTVIDVKTNDVLIRRIYFLCGPCTGTPINSVWDFRAIPRCECALEKRKKHGGFYKQVNMYKDLGKENDY
jgi:hypothetical protein